MVYDCEYMRKTPIYIVISNNIDHETSVFTRHTCKREGWCGYNMPLPPEALQFVGRAELSYFNEHFTAEDYERLVELAMETLQFENDLVD